MAQDRVMEDSPNSEHERLELLERINRWLETPMMVLAFVWLALIVLEFVGEPSEGLEIASIAIWSLFAIHFALEFVLAPRKLHYLRAHRITAISLVVPAFRLARVAPLVRMLRAARGLRLIKVVGSLNRGMRALGASMGRRGFGYVMVLTLLVTTVGAAGIYALEPHDSEEMNSYGDALWWTAMLMTTMGSSYWPQSTEGRLLCLFLSTYAFAVFGYVTATLATFFIGRDAEDTRAELPGRDDFLALRKEIAAMRTELANRNRGDQETHPDDRTC